MRLGKLDLKLKQRLVQGVVEFKVNVLGCFFSPVCCAEDAHCKYPVLSVTGSCSGTLASAFNEILKGNGHQY